MEVVKNRQVFFCAVGSGYIPFFTVTFRDNDCISSLPLGFYPEFGVVFHFIFQGNFLSLLSKICQVVFPGSYRL